MTIRPTSTFNPLKARARRNKSKVSTLTDKSVRECTECGLMKVIPTGFDVCDTCEVNGQDY